MSTVGAVSIEARLNQDQLARDLVEVKRELAGVKSVEPKVNLVVQGLDGVKEAAKTVHYLTKTVKDAVEIVGTIGGALNAVGIALDAASQKVGGMSDKAQTLSEKALKSAVSFDSARAKVATLSDESGEFASQMQQLSGDLNYQVGSTDLLNASYDVLSSGFSKASDNATILKASALGAQGGFSTVGKVADATTTALNAFNLKASDAGKVVDILAQTQDKGKITIDQYAGQLGRVASIASMAGVGLEEVSAAVATATAKGVPAESAVSGMRQAIVNLLKPTDDAQKLLKQFGIENSTAALKSQGLIGILKTLQAKGATSDQLSKIFSDVDALALVTPLAGENIKDFQANLDAMANSAGKAEKSAAAVANSFDGRMTQAANAADKALVSLGEGVKLVILPFAILGATALSAFNALPEPLKQVLGATLAVAGASGALLGGLLAVASVVPLLIQLYTVMKARQALSNALMVSGSLAAKAKAFALSFLGTQTAAATAATAANTASTAANTGATIASTTIAKGRAAVMGFLATQTAAAAAAEAAGTKATIAQRSVLIASTAIAQTKATIMGFLATQTAAAAAAETASTGATIGGTAAKAAGTVVTAAYNLVTGVGVGLKKLWSLEAAKAAAATLKFTGTLALAAAAMWTLGELFKRSEGAQFANQLDENTRRLREFRAEAAKPQAKPEGAGSNKESLESVFQNKGAIEGARAAIADLDQALGGASDRASQFGAAWGAITAQQRGNQLAQIALADSMTEEGNQVQIVTDLLAKYGLVTLEANDRTRLGAKGLEDFKQAAGKQIEALDLSIAKLKEQKAPNAAMQQQLDDQVKLLERNKEALRQRIAFLEGDTSATKDNATAQGQLKVSLEAVLKAREQAAGKSDQVAKEYQAGIKEMLANGKIAEEAAQKEQYDSEAAAIDRRLKLVRDSIPKLKAAKVGATGEELEKADKALLDSEKEITDLRIQAAEKALSEKKRVNQETLEGDRRTAAQAVAASKNAASDAVAAVRGQQASGSLSKEDAEVEVSRLRQAETTKELQLTQDALSQLEDRKAQGLLKEKDYAQEKMQLEGKVHDLKLKNVEAEVSARESAEKRAIQQIEQRQTAAKAKSQLAQGSARIAAKRAQVSGKLDEDGAAKQMEAAQQKALAAQIAGAEQALAAVKQARAQGTISAEAAAEKERSLQQEIQQATIARLDAELAARKRVLEQIDKQLVKEKQASQLKQGAVTIAAKRAQVSGKLDEDAASAQIEAANRQAMEAQIAANNRAIAAVRQAKAKGQITAQQAAEKEKQLQGEVQQATISRLDAELAAQKRNRDRAMEAIEARVAAEKRRHDKAIAQLDLEHKRQIEFAQTALELTERRAKAAGEVGSARSSLAIKTGEIDLKRFDDAIALSAKVAEVEVPPEVKAEAQRQLLELGFAGGATELQLFDARVQKENELAQLKRQALEQEQALQQRLLEFEIKKQGFAAKSLQLEAQKNILLQQQAQEQAKLALQKAQALEPGQAREGAIADAQQQLEFATQGYGLAQEQLKLAADQAAAIGDEVAARKEVLGLQQLQADREADAEESARMRGNRMRRAEMAAPKRTTRNDREQAKSEAGAKPEAGVTRPGASGAVNVSERGGVVYRNYSTRGGGEAATAPDAPAAQTQAPANLGYLKALVSAPSAAPTQSSFTAPTPVKPTETPSLPAGASTELGALGAKFDRLSEAILQLANQPRSLTVQSENPVQNASKIWRDFGKQQLQGAGL